MKKITRSIFLAALLISMLNGCGKNKTELPDTGSPDGQEGPVNPEGASDSLASVNFAIQDNSLDAYSAIVNTPMGVENYSGALNALGVENPANAVAGGIKRLFLGTSRAFYFSKHLFDKGDKCWDELSFVTVEGKAGAQGFDLEHQLWGIGPAAGTDHYVTLDYESGKAEGDYRYFLTERAENHKALRQIPLDFLNNSAPHDINVNFALDQSGTAHLLRQAGQEQQYLLVSPTGEILTEYVPEEDSILGLVPLYDGRVAFRAAEQGHEAQGLRTTLQYMDAQAGRPMVLSALEKETYCFTLFDENTLLYADAEGVYRSDLSGNHPELLYRWLNHGIAALGVSAMQTDAEGRIALLYESPGKDNCLFLEPTTEDTDLCELILAVPFYRVSTYEPLVVEFNKRHPDYHIEIKSDYDKTALLAALIAGKGPVLIDTFLTGFEEQEKLWEPLDTVIEEAGITDTLHPVALESGKIHGGLYGIVTDFTLNTLITGDTALKDWDYDTFLQCVEARPNLEAIFDYYGGNYGIYFITHFLSHGLEDTYLLDAETGTMNFDSDEFRNILAMAKKYCLHEEGVKPGSSLLDGKVLCNVLTINKPEKLAAYRVCYGEDANYIGYPTKDGATHYIESSSPLAIRRTATEEEKDAAAAFIRLCLSYEGQSLAAKDLNFGLSVRSDVLEEQITSMDEHTAVFASGFEPFILGDDLNIDLDRKTLLDMIDKARPLRYLPTELGTILSEELEQYFSDVITEDMLIDHLESRVGLYLEERN